ncbi:MAG: ISL3 family transposase, partial [Caldibacillus debilis]
MNRNLFLPGLKDVKINKVEICEHSIHLYVEMPVKPHRCPRCGTEGRKIHDYRIQKIRHFKWFERPTVIFYRKRRYVCQACGKRFAEENPFVERYQRFSKEW